MDITKGWKGYLGAAIVMLTGLYLIAIGNVQEGAALFGVGLSLLGIRHKLDYSEEQ